MIKIGITGGIASGKSTVSKLMESYGATIVDADKIGHLVYEPGTDCLKDVVKAIAPNAKIKIIGIRPGEKRHEEMISPNDSDYTYEYRDFYVILPKSIFVSRNYIKNLNIKTKTKAKKCKSDFSYNSQYNKKFLSVKEIKLLIKKNIN